MNQPSCSYAPYLSKEEIIAGEKQEQKDKKEFFQSLDRLITTVVGKKNLELSKKD